MTNPIATALESIFKYQTCQRCGGVVLSAINEIEVLTLERDKARRERDELRQQVENIKNGFEGGCYLCEVVGEMNKRLQKELDDALVDQALIEELWERRTDATEMQEQIKLLRKERDEARKQICESHSRNRHQAYQHAIECNWDCYKETP